MRAVIISLPMPGEGGQPSIAGKTIAERQLLFARELDCEAVIAHGGGASGDAIALRYAAESAGLRFQVVTNAHALPGIIGSGDSLLVVQPGLLPEAAQALDLLRAEGGRMLVVSSGPGTTAGFERIDLDRAWAGVLTVPGNWLEHLTALPEDSAPHAALLRICLQRRLPEARLGDAILDGGEWVIIGDAAKATRHEQTWLAQHVGEAKPAATSRWLGARLVSIGGPRLLQQKWSGVGMAGIGMAMLLAAVAAIWFDIPWAAFALAGLSAPVVEGFLALARLSSAPFGRAGKLHVMRYGVDAVLLVIGVLAIDGFWYRAAFPPLVLAAALLLLDRRKLRPTRLGLRDRGLVAAGLAVLSAITAPEIAIMAVTTLLLFALIFPEMATRD